MSMRNVVLAIKLVFLYVLSLSMLDKKIQGNSIHLFYNFMSTNNTSGN